MDSGGSCGIAVKAASPGQSGAAPPTGLGSNLVKNLRLEGFAGLLVARIVPLFHHPFLQPGGQGTPVVDILGILGIDIGSTSGGCRGSDRGRWRLPPWTTPPRLARQQGLDIGWRPAMLSNQLLDGLRQVILPLLLTLGEKLQGHLPVLFKLGQLLLNFRKGHVLKIHDLLRVAGT